MDSALPKSYINIRKTPKRPFDSSDLHELPCGRNTGRSPTYSRADLAGACGNGDSVISELLNGMRRKAERPRERLTRSMVIRLGTSCYRHRGWQAGNMLVRGSSAQEGQSMDVGKEHLVPTTMHLTNRHRDEYVVGTFRTAIWLTPSLTPETREDKGLGSCPREFNGLVTHEDKIRLQPLITTVLRVLTSRRVVRVTQGQIHKL